MDKKILRDIAFAGIIFSVIVASSGTLHANDCHERCLFPFENCLKNAHGGSPVPCYEQATNCLRACG